ncbi:MAG: glycosyl hydrolase [Algibacter sp.]|uniref:glycosyl hydrolase n=1 Tax=Algibacter sp. TaxID=1872428 RepID=UPI003299CAC5
MNKLKLVLLSFLFAFSSYAQTNTCGLVIEDTFDSGTAASNNWTEYSTSGKVTIVDGKLKFNLNNDTPSAFRTFTPTSNNLSLSFDVEGSRNTMNYQIDLISSTGKFIASIALGKATSDIKYATSMGNAIPSDYIAGVIGTAKFAKNTTYTLAMYLDFNDQTVDFYNSGVLTLENIPFLETSSDFGKINTQLLYMYSNNGTAHLDNIIIIESSELRVSLSNVVESSNNDINTASIGDKYGQYPQSAVNDFQESINNATTVLEDCESTDTSINNSISELEAAQVTFANAKVNNPVLKIYPAYNFSGEEHEMYCGYYNGDLGMYDDWAVSFTLEKGYMVTFAENINGTGASKVYVAAENDLQINLPVDLQKKVSFIRVGPWFDIHKKGMAGKGIDVIQEFNNSWHYNWSISGNDVGEAKFVPNQWGGGTVTNAVSLGNRMDIAHYMAFNEPDGSEQANMTVDKAIEKYEAMLASGLRLGSPANKDNASGGVWRDEFMTKAEANGLRVDFIVVHYYKKTSPSNFYNWLKAIHDKWKRPIWIKEFNYGATWTSQPASNEDAGNGLISYMNMLDDTSFVERYSVFTWQPDKPIYSLMETRTPVTLSRSGIMYRDHQSPLAYTQEVYEQGEQLSVDSNLLESEVLIYPTIVKDGFLNMIYGSEIKNVKIDLTIYNSVGQIVIKDTNINEKIDVSKLSSGFYIVELASDMGLYTKKIIIN